MKPIFMFAIAAIAAAGIGAGSLNNVIDVTSQNFGVGSDIIDSPIDAASVDFTITAVPVGEGQDAELKNLVTACSFHSDESIEGEATIICKLTDIDAKVVAEGRLTVADYLGSTTIPVIEIDILAYPGANSVTNIHDVTLIVLGNNPTTPPFPTPAP